MSRIPVHRSNNPSTRCCIAEFRGGSIPVFRDNVTKKSRNAYGIAFVDRFSRYPRSDSPRRRSALPASRIPVVIVDGWMVDDRVDRHRDDCWRAEKREKYQGVRTWPGQIHALVPVQTRRGDWEILRTVGSGSRLVLLLLLRPLAPSMLAAQHQGNRDAYTRVREH